MAGHCSLVALESTTVGCKGWHETALWVVSQATRSGFSCVPRMRRGEDAQMAATVACGVPVCWPSASHTVKTKSTYGAQVLGNGDGGGCRAR